MEYINSDLFTTKVPINLIDNNSNKPYFFIKWSKKTERYRVSTSFKYLNLKFGLHINIIRDIKKSLSTENNIFLENKYFLENKRVIDKNFYYYYYSDLILNTEIFFIVRTWDNSVSETIVFFSKKYWSLDDYLTRLRKKEQ
jgi:hypothetical protein